LLGLTVREAVMAIYLVAGALGLAGILLTVAGFKSGMTLVALLIAGAIVAGYKLEQVYGCHLSAVSHQLSAVSHQRSAAGDQSSAVGSQPTAGTGAIRSQPNADG
jgi:hypothetical protein